MSQAEDITALEVYLPLSSIYVKREAKFRPARAEISVQRVWETKYFDNVKIDETSVPTSSGTGSSFQKGFFSFHSKINGSNGVL